MMLGAPAAFLMVTVGGAAAGAGSGQRGGAVCDSIDDCFLGGECRASRCVCDPWRTAPNCSQLSLLPVAAASAGAGGGAGAPPQVYPGEGGWSSWGGQVLFSGGSYHMFAARFSHRCGLNSWWCNSEVVHAEADRPDGPYSTSPGLPVVAPFAHNPAVAVAPDGTVLVFHIGSGDTPRSRQGNCSGGVSGVGTNGTRAWCGAAAAVAAFPGAPVPPRAGEVNAPNIAYSSAGPRGPWSLLGGGSSWGADNPAPVVLENGTVLLYAKFGCNATVNPRAAACYQYGLLRADHWRGPWSFVRMIEVFGEDVAAWYVHKVGP